ncbi:protein ALP1-like [Xyrichtys novacula]|uniref:Protein ALP1-like n=1 Tax=Xyrichtys novacula TaxID=13765 RepID=A0AAV1FYG6_XYRNO|nr:protein ALP1-like [Xyrichtys novacula]
MTIPTMQTRPLYYRVNIGVPVFQHFFAAADTREDFRLSRESLAVLLDPLKQERRHGWGATIKTLALVFWLASGASHRVVSRVFGMTRSTVHRVTEKVDHLPSSRARHPYRLQVFLPPAPTPPHHLLQAAGVRCGSPALQWASSHACY